MNTNNIEYRKISAFSLDGRGGNSAGIVFPANQLRQDQRQDLATKFGYSETAFIDQSVLGSLRLEYFTPNRKIDLCGHATVGAFSYLRDSKIIDLGEHFFDSELGLQRVLVQEESVGLFQEQKINPVELPDPYLDIALKSLELSSTDIKGNPKIASNGSAFLFIEVKKIDTLRQLRPNRKQILALSEQLDLVGYYIYFQNSNRQLEARMFAPLYGIDEESATGMAAGALALLLENQLKDKELTILQGHLMNPPVPAKLTANLQGDGKVLVSGETTVI